MLNQKQTEFYVRKLKSTKEILTKKGIIFTGNAENITNGSEAFKDFCMQVARVLTKGPTLGLVYAATVAYYAEKAEVPYTAYVGFCLPKDSPKYEEEKKAYENSKDSGAFVNHMYIQIGDCMYEYFNGSPDIEHIEVMAVNI